MKVGEKGQVVIPKELRELTGIKEGTEVTFEVADGGVIVRRAGPKADSYVDYFVSTFSKKLKHDVDIKKALEEERLERQDRVR